MNHLCAIGDLSDDDVDAILQMASQLRDNPASSDLLRGRIIASAFFEPSTRTRLSFEAAAHRLGADVIGFSEATSTSSAKGETLEDSVRVLSGYADALVLRHPDTGAATRAAAVSAVPVINAGDGAGEHPTQTLIDLFTMQQCLGGLSGRTVAVLGDLTNGRTVHSLVPALQRFDVAVVQVPAGDLKLNDASVPEVSLEEAARSCDVLYMTRVQKERMSGDVEPLIIDASLLENSAAIVMHPLPRVNEIKTDVDALPAAKYFEQARNGVPVRMAILAHVLGATP